MLSNYTNAFSVYFCFINYRRTNFFVKTLGDDSTSRKITDWLETPSITAQLNNDRIICVRLSTGSPLYLQFARIYQLVPVPSIFFLFHSGVPIEIITSLVQSSEELHNKIRSVILKYFNVSRDFSGEEVYQEIIMADPGWQQYDATLTQSQNSNAISNLSDINLLFGTGATGTTNTSNVGTPSAAPENHSTKKNDESRLIAGADDNIAQKPSTSLQASKPNTLEEDKNEMGTSKDTSALNAKKESIKETNGKPSEITSNEVKNTVVERQEKSNNDEKKQSKNELNVNGSEETICEVRKLQLERNTKILNEIKRERLAEKEARERVKAQIAVDRLEQMERFAAVQRGLTENKNKTDSIQQPTNNPKPNANRVSLQFRYGNGEILTHNFMNDTKLTEVREYVKTTITMGVNEFSLETVYPVHEFTVEEEEMTLEQLNLVPNAVIMVIMKKRAGLNNLVAKPRVIFYLLQDVIWVFLKPVVSSVQAIKTWLIGRNTNGPSNDNNTSSTVQSYVINNPPLIYLLI